MGKKATVTVHPAYRIGDISPRLFGAFLDKTGAGNFFINLSYSITGRFSGGPAKTAVVASGFMGSVAGSAGREY